VFQSFQTFAGKRQFKSSMFKVQGKRSLRILLVQIVHTNRHEVTGNSQNMSVQGVQTIYELTGSSRAEAYL